MGLVLDRSKVTGTLTEQPDLVPTLRNRFLVPRGSESAREAAYDFHVVLVDAAKKWLGEVFPQDPQAVYAQLRPNDSSVRRVARCREQHLSNAMFFNFFFQGSILFPVTFSFVAQAKTEKIACA